mgnify:CR=1 FL=1
MDVNSVNTMQSNGIDELNADEATVKEKVHRTEAVQRALEGKNIVKEIYVKNKIYNIVVK